MARDVPGVVLVPARMDNAMVTATGKRRDSARFGLRLLLLTIAAVAAIAVQSWRTGDFKSLWWTPDQQAQRLYNDFEFKDAYERFENPAWKGVAAYDSGLYSESAASFGRLPTAEAFFNRGNAFMKGREYAKAIVAYQQAVIEAPDWVEAKENLELATYTLEYIERVREQSDTGDESELGADEYVFDNTKERGIEIEITQQSTIEQESAEKWMRGVDTDTRDFLRSRFLLEASREDLAE